MARVNIGTASNAAGAESLAINVNPVAGVPAGVTILVAVSTEGVGALTTPPSVTDDASSSYTVDLARERASDQHVMRLFRVSNNGALAQNDKITISWAHNLGTDSSAATAWYEDDLALVDPIDVAVAGGGGSSTTPDSGSAETTVANTVMIGVLSKRGLLSEVTQDGDFSSNIAGAEADTSDPATSTAIFIGDRDLTATLTDNYAPSLSVTRSWLAGLVAYKKAAAAAGNPWYYYLNMELSR